MAPARWQTVQEVFHAVREASGDTDSLLEDLCSGDKDLRRQVEALLSADAEAGEFLEPTTTGALARQGQPDFFPTDSAVGPYRILKDIGRGGSSTVYLAERANADYTRRIALKVLHSGLDGESYRRFLDERRILATLNHPSIVTFFDAGTTDDGRPYFAMEPVAGTPIDDYCDTNALGLEERLLLFRDLCQAVHYAHRHLIVHRDIKPSNVLVTSEGMLKLLDFGIAKPLDPGVLNRDRELTRTDGMRPLTPEYASPEQLRGMPITVSTDVYLLGLLLYKLLTGRLPLRHPGHAGQASPETPKPSLVALSPRDRQTSGPAEAVPAEVSPPSTLTKETGQLRQRLAGDLDRILLMALREEPERRYQSAEQFGGDLDRYLRGLPVRAVEDSLRYRCRKFLVRNKILMGASILLALVVLGLGSAMAWQAHRAATARDRAEMERAKAEQVSGLLFDVFRASEPVVARGERVTARELLEVGTRRVRAELDEQPEVKATALDTLGRVYQGLGLHDRAALLLQEALDLRKELFGEEHLDTASSLAALGRATRALARYEIAEQQLGEVLELRRRLLGEPTPEVAESLYDLAFLHWRRGAYESAEQLHRQALATRRALYGDRHPLVAASLNQLGLVLAERGELAAAGRAYREALTIRRAVLDSDHPDLGESASNLAYVLGELEQFEPAEKLFAEALDIRLRVLGANHPSTASTQHSWAILLLKAGRPAEAEQLFRAALETREALFGKKHPSYAATISVLAEALRYQGELTRAAALYEESISVALRMVGDRHPAVSFPLVGYGTLLMELGKLQQAEATLRQALELRQQGLPPGNMLTAEAMGMLGKCLLALGQISEAESLLAGSHDTLAANTPPLGRQLATVRQALIDLYEETGRPAEARKYRILLEEMPEQLRSASLGSPPSGP